MADLQRNDARPRAAAHEVCVALMGLTLPAQGRRVIPQVLAGVGERLTKLHRGIGRV
jgi:hypothetical protein